MSTRIHNPALTQRVLSNSALENFYAFFALTAADDFAVAIGRDQIATERIFTRACHARTADRVGLLEVERLDLRWHVVNENRLCQILRRAPLLPCGAPVILAPGNRDSATFSRESSARRRKKFLGNGPLIDFELR